MAVKKTYSKEFKLDAISLIKEQGYSRTEAAGSLGISPYTKMTLKNAHGDIYTPLFQSHFRSTCTQIQPFTKILTYLLSYYAKWAR